MLTRSWGDNGPTNVVFTCEWFSAQSIQQIVVIGDRPKIMGENKPCLKAQTRVSSHAESEESCNLVDPQLDYNTHSLINIHHKYNPCLLFGARL